MSTPRQLIIRELGTQDYVSTWTAMREFNAKRNTETRDEIWLLQHPPVYTQGMSCKALPLAQAPTEIPVVASDRGGQMTYHGPGQAIAYLMINVRQRGWGPRRLVQSMEQSIIDLLATHGINGQRREGAPGIYVDDAKIAALGLRISRGGSYHGLSMNVDMDLSPFDYIDPCGFTDLRITQLIDHGVCMDCAEVARDIGHRLAQQIGYGAVSFEQSWNTSEDCQNFQRTGS